MNAIQAAAEAFVEILRDAGVPVTIGGKDYQAMISPSGLAVDLEEGRFTQDGVLTIRLLVAHIATPLPAHNETILIGSDRHKIDEINRKPGDPKPGFDTFANAWTSQRKF
ncbi:MAG: hypothetical protein ORN51_15160 [Akkermansiaceae bacterium]|nr:hypothetical protein [Akkermansiaceae bacterium]